MSGSLWLEPFLLSVQVSALASILAFGLAVIAAWRMSRTAFRGCGAFDRRNGAAAAPVCYGAACVSGALVGLYSRLCERTRGVRGNAYGCRQHPGPDPDAADGHLFRGGVRPDGISVDVVRRYYRGQLRIIARGAFFHKP
jgi:hypothetical protein